MGRQHHSIENIFNSNPTIEDYMSFDADLKLYVDDIIRTGLKQNHILRLNDLDLHPRESNLWFLSWEQMIELKRAVSQNKMIEALMVVYRLEEREFIKLGVFNCFAVYKWITEQLKSIAEIEKQELYSEPTIEERNAGIEMLQPFDYVVSLDALAGGDVLKYNEILETPYSIIFRKQCLEKVKSQIQKNFIKNANRKT